MVLTSLVGGREACYLLLLLLLLLLLCRRWTAASMGVQVGQGEKLGRMGRRRGRRRCSMTDNECATNKQRLGRCPVLKREGGCSPSRSRRGWGGGGPDKKDRERSCFEASSSQERTNVGRMTTTSGGWVGGWGSLGVIAVTVGREDLLLLLRKRGLSPPPPPFRRRPHSSIFFPRLLLPSCSFLFLSSCSVRSS